MDQSNSDNNQTNSSAPNSNKEECSEKMDAALANYDETEPEYAIVAERLDDLAEVMELPIDPDKTLGLNTLTHAFPGASGIKYRNPVTGALRALSMNTSGNKFVQPPGGWSGKKFVVIYLHQPPTTNVPHVKKSANENLNAKRRKLMIQRDDEVDDDDDEGEPVRQNETVDKSKVGKKEVSVAKPVEPDDDDLSAICDEVTDLIVLGLPFKLNADELREFFEKFGTVAHAEVKMANGQSKGFGFIQMSSLEEQANVLRNKGIHTIGNRRCQVRVPFTKVSGPKGPLSNKVFVGRISESTSRDDLRDFFTQEAEKIEPGSGVTSVFIPRPFRAFAFLTFNTPRGATEIIKKTEFDMNGTHLSVSTANPRFVQYMQQGIEAPYAQGQAPFVRVNRGRPPPPYFEEAYQEQQQQRREGEWYGSHNGRAGGPKSPYIPPSTNPYPQHQHSSDVLGIYKQEQSTSASIRSTTPNPPQYYVDSKRISSNYQKQPSTDGNGQGHYGTNGGATSGQQLSGQLETLNISHHDIVAAALQMFAASLAAATTGSNVTSGVPASVASSAHLQRDQQSLSPTPPGYKHHQQHGKRSPASSTINGTESYQPHVEQIRRNNGRGAGQSWH